MHSNNNNGNTKMVNCPTHAHTHPLTSLRNKVVKAEVVVAAAAVVVVEEEEGKAFIFSNI